MAVKYLSGNRIWGTNAERLAMSTAGTFTYDSTNTSTGTGSGGNGDTIMVSKSSTQLSTDDVIGSIGIRVYSDSAQPYDLKFVVYTDSGSAPSTLICNSIALSPSGTGSNVWIEGAIEGGNHTVTSGEAGYVWIGAWMSALTGSQIQYNNESMTDGIRQMDSQTYNASGTPATTFSDNTQHPHQMRCRVGIVDTPAVYPSLPNGSVFITSDTNVHYMWNGTDTWNEVA